MGASVTPAHAAARALAFCDHVERFAYERQGAGLDASPHMLAGATRLLVAVFLPESTNWPAPAAPPAWAWWSGSSDEWYEHGPFASRDEAVAELAGQGGFVVEALPGAPIHLDAESLIQAQYFDDNDAFDYDHAEPDRVGEAADIKVADAALQALLDGWCEQYGHTFRRGNLFAATRNQEQIGAASSEEVVVDRDGPR